MPESVLHFKGYIVLRLHQYIIFIQNSQSRMQHMYGLHCFALLSP